MQESDVLETLRRVARRAGEQVASAKREYRRGRIAGSLPKDAEGRARIVCRRYAEQRAVAVEEGRPSCFEANHPACEGCVADIEEGVIETW